MSECGIIAYQREAWVLKIINELYSGVVPSGCIGAAI
jgi:hypothetical protein